MSDDYATTADFDLVSAVNRMVRAYQALAPRPLGPMIVPGWLPDLAAERNIDLDATARWYGFDGYEVFSDTASPGCRPVWTARSTAGSERSGSCRSRPAAC
jgi:hypothetical protein